MITHAQNRYIVNKVHHFICACMRFLHSSCRHHMNDAWEVFSLRSLVSVCFRFITRYYNQNSTSQNQASYSRNKEKSKINKYRVCNNNISFFNDKHASTTRDRSLSIESAEVPSSLSGTRPFRIKISKGGCPLNF